MDAVLRMAPNAPIGAGQHVDQPLGLHVLGREEEIIIDTGYRQPTFPLNDDHSLEFLVIKSQTRRAIFTHNSHGFCDPGAPLVKVVVDGVFVERLLDLPLLPPHVDERPALDRRQVVVS